MDNNLIADNFFDNADSVIIKKNFLLWKFIFRLTIVLAILDLLYWYIVISHSIHRSGNSFSFLYSYRLLPMAVVVLIAVTISGSIFYMRANKMMILSIQNADTELFNSAYNLFYRCSKLSVVSVTINIILVGIRLFLNQL